MSTSPYHIVFAEDFDPSAIQKMREIGRVTVVQKSDGERALIEAIRDCDALLVRSCTVVSRAMLEQAPRLRVVGRGGAGLDNIDIEAAEERGVRVVHTPDAGTEAVADLTVGLLISMLRNIDTCDAMVRSGSFREAREQSISPQLGELTLGIIGLGRIGKAVARRCRNGFGMKVLYNDIVLPGLLDFVATPVKKEELYGRSDVISLHVPLTNKTRSLLNEESFKRFKPGSLLINTSRGAVVDGEALARALTSGALAGAALDVFDPEPLPPGHPLMASPGTLFTPHIGARTVTSLKRMNGVVEDVIRVLKGKGRY